MPLTRLGKRDRIELAIDDLVRLGASLDEVEVVASGPDTVNVDHRDEGWPAQVLPYDAVDEPTARELVRTAAGGHSFLVANRIAEPARTYLTSAGWAWLDRRVGAHLPFGARDVEVRFVERGENPTELQRAGGPWAEDSPRPSADGPIRGRAGIAYAAALLVNPERPPSFRSVAAAVEMSPTAVGNAARLLGRAGLVDADGRPTLPELFWALADVWAPLKALPVASVPDPDDPRIPGRRHAEEVGWALGGDLAAAELGAPVFTSETRPLLWVPTQVDLRRAERRYGAASWDDRAAVLAVSPTPLVCRHRQAGRPGASGWMLPQTAFAALDLAGDRERGREILDAWSPGGANVVWR